MLVLVISCTLWFEIFAFQLQIQVMEQFWSYILTVQLHTYRVQLVKIMYIALNDHFIELQECLIKI